MKINLWYKQQATSLENPRKEVHWIRGKRVHLFRGKKTHLFRGKKVHLK